MYGGYGGSMYGRSMYGGYGGGMYGGYGGYGGMYGGGMYPGMMGSGMGSSYAESMCLERRFQGAKHFEKAWRVA